MLAPGTYTVEISDANACTESVEIEIAQPDTFSITLFGPDTITFGEEVTLQVSLSNPLSAIETVVWNPDANCEDCLEVQVQPPGTTTYNVTVTDSSGCIASDNHRVTVITNTGVFVPNVFSPNGDGINDMFFIEQTGFISTVSNLTIYDRWGAIVYRASGQQPPGQEAGWDGTLNGEALMPGVYVYKVLVTFGDGSERLLHGDITLVR